jgi:hypothetical protein
VSPLAASPSGFANPRPNAPGAFARGSDRSLAWWCPEDGTNANIAPDLSRKRRSRESCGRFRESKTFMDAKQRRAGGFGRFESARRAPARVRKKAGKTGAKIVARRRRRRRRPRARTYRTGSAAPLGASSFLTSGMTSLARPNAAASELRVSSRPVCGNGSGCTKRDFEAI